VNIDSGGLHHNSTNPKKRSSTMYAIVRLNSFDAAKLAAGDDRLQQFDKLHTAQPGYVGSIVIDLQAGRRLTVNLWESEEHSAAALSILGSKVGPLLSPLMSSPSELIGAGTVIASDL
jgi:hypothetical protein